MYGGPRKKKKPERSVEDILASLKGEAKQPGYREAAIKLFGLVCAKCGREFSDRDRHLLTVHHRDGNASNNPPDGSNWECLCGHCHEDEHSRGLLGDYLKGK